MIEVSTTVPPICNITCLNQTWLSSANLLAQWEFDGSYADTTNTYNGTPPNSPPTFVSGFIGQAASFINSLNEAISAGIIPLANRSFTVDGWFYPTGYPGSGDNTIVGMCQAPSGHDLCLHIVLRHTSPSIARIYFGFFGDDVNSSVDISPNQWFHAAMVFDMSIMQQFIYLNGILISVNKTATTPLFASGTPFFIGFSPNYVPASTYNGFQVKLIFILIICIVRFVGIHGSYVS